MLIHFLTARTFKAHCFTFPLRVFAENLRDLGITIKFHYRLTPRLGECDVLCIGKEFFKPTTLNSNPPNRYKVLEYYRSKMRTVIWFDTSAGTGKTSFSVMPYVDLYAKNQVLRDRQLYTRSFYGDDIVAEYYHSRGVKDPSQNKDKRSPIRSEDLEKLVVSWNIGLGDLGGFYNLNKLERGYKILFPSARYKIRSTAPGEKVVTIDASFRGKTVYTRYAVTHHRRETVRQLKQLSDTSDYRIIHEGSIPYHEYLDEMRRTRIIVSPFGLGEICFRDFESMISGALLLKPEVNHLETWPDIFEPDITFIPYAWDFTDFQEKLHNLLRDPDRCIGIARAGQNRYLNSISRSGGDSFCRHFHNLIQRAIGS